MVRKKEKVKNLWKGIKIFPFPFYFLIFTLRLAQCKLFT